MTYYTFICNTCTDKSYLKFKKTKSMDTILSKKIPLLVDAVHRKLLEDKALVSSYIDDDDSSKMRIKVACGENFPLDLKMVWLSSLLSEYRITLYVASAHGNGSSVTLIATEKNIQVKIIGPEDKTEKKTVPLSSEDEVLDAIQIYELWVRELLERELW